MHEQMAEMFFINEIRQEAEEEAKKKAAEAAGRAVSHQTVKPQKASHLLEDLFRLDQASEHPAVYM